MELQGKSELVRGQFRVEIGGYKMKQLLHLPDPDPGRHWEAQPTMWTISAAPVSIFDANTAVNAGWAVDTCNTEWDLGGKPKDSNLLGSMAFFMDIAIRDSDAFLARLSYDFRAAGDLVQRPGDVGVS